MSFLVGSNFGCKDILLRPHSFLTLPLLKLMGRIAAGFVVFTQLFLFDSNPPSLKHTSSTKQAEDSGSKIFSLLVGSTDQWQTGLKQLTMNLSNGLNIGEFKLVQ